MVSKVSFPADELALGKMSPADFYRAIQLQLNDTGRKENASRPVEGYLELASERRHLAQVHGAPENPRGEARKPQPQDFRDRVVTADGRHDTERPERERPCRPVG